MAKRLPEGISHRHARACPARSGGRCRCAPTYQAKAWSPRDRKRLTRTFPTLAAARGWRYDALVGLRHGTLRDALGLVLGGVRSLDGLLELDQRRGHVRAGELAQRLRGEVLV
jgi:hypothetical protein